MSVKHKSVSITPISNKNSKRYLVVKNNIKITTLKNWIESYTDKNLIRDNEKVWSKGYQKEVERKLNKHLLLIIGDIEASKLRFHHLRKAILSSSTASEKYHLLRIIHGFLAFGIDKGFTNINFEKTYQRLSKEFKISQRNDDAKSHQFIDPKLIPSESDIKNLIAEVTNLPNGKWYYPLIFILSYSSGMRLSEILDLDTDSIDLKKREIRVKSQVYEVTGSKKERGAPKYGIARTTVYPLKTAWGYEVSKNISKRVREAKKEPRFFYGSDAPRNLLFPAPKGGWWSKQNFTKRIRIPAQSNANWPLDNNNNFIWSFHSLRHAYTKNLLDKGFDLGIIAKVLGYKSPTTILNMYYTDTTSSIDQLK
jgi:integrase